MKISASPEAVLITMVMLSTNVCVSAQSIGPLQVSDIEAAFGLATGSIFIEGDAEFTTIQDQNLWTEYQDLPYYLSRFIPSEFNPPRQQAASLLAALGRPMLQITPTAWFERFLVGCFYLPREQDIVDFFNNNMLETCNDVAGFAGTWNVVGFVDEETILVSFLATASETQYMTQLAVFTSGVASLEGDEVVAITVSGPSVGVYANYSTPEEGIDIFATNIGQFFAAFQPASLDEDCPDEVCGSYLAPPLVETAVPNPLAPAWPETVTANQCAWWPEASVCTIIPSVGPTASPSTSFPTASPSSGLDVFAGLGRTLALAIGILSLAAAW
jgi:hypothetical protein